MATVAVFVALGGSSYAAVTLKKGSVRGKHIARNAVTSPKVKDGALRARDFAPGELASAKAGDSGPPGPAGPPGPPGPEGPPNPNAVSAENAEKLDGLDSGDLKLQCTPSDKWVYYGGVCWERSYAAYVNYEVASAHCGTLGGRLPLLSEFYAVVNGGPLTPGQIVGDWAADATADNQAVYINNPNQATDIDGVQATTALSHARCVKPPVNALGTP
jgi:hypothetical protein